MDKYARKVVLMYIMFLIASCIFLTIPEFKNVLLHGGIVSLVAIPAIYTYYSDESRFFFT